MDLRHNKRCAIVFMLMMSFPVCAGYDNYSDAVPWESVDDREGGVVAHYYQWNNGMTSHENIERMYNPAYFGLPPDTRLCFGGGPIRWTYIAITGPKYAVLYNNTIYTNSTDVVYEVGYLPEPKTSLNGITIDSVTAIERSYDGQMLEVDITCNWHTSKRRTNGKGIKKDHRTTIIHQKVHNNITTWVQADEYSGSVECIITNHSGHYNTISVTGLPGDATHYNIGVVMGNRTESLLKSSYVFFKNTSVDYQLYDMYDYDYYELNGVSPYGKDVFATGRGYIDDIEIIVSSPFASYRLDTNITRIDKESNIHYEDICAAVMCFVIAYVIYRMVRVW